MSGLTTYLAYKRLPEICERQNAQIDYRPVLLGGIFKATGNSSPITVPAKGQHMLVDLGRFAKRHGVTMNMNPNFPLNSINLMRGAYVAEELDCLEPYNGAMFDAVWKNRKNMGDNEGFREVMEQADLPAGETLEGIGRQEIKDKLKARTEEAVKRGAYGCPTMFVGSEMYFGQDRLDFVEEALAA